MTVHYSNYFKLNDFDYELEADEEKEFIKVVLNDFYSLSINEIDKFYEFLNDLDLLDTIYGEYYDTLLEYFYENAYELYLDGYQTLKSLGLSERDFL